MMSVAESDKSDRAFGLIHEVTFKVPFVLLAYFHGGEVQGDRSRRSPWIPALRHGLMSARPANSSRSCLAFVSAFTTDCGSGTSSLGFLLSQLASSVAERFAVLLERFPVLLERFPVPLEDAGVLAPLFDAISTRLSSTQLTCHLNLIMLPSRDLDVLRNAYEYHYGIRDSTWKTCTVMVLI